MTSPYDWFADWVENHVMVTLTATRGPDVARLLAEFGRSGFDQGERTLDETFAFHEPTVRIGTAAQGFGPRPVAAAAGFVDGVLGFTVSRGMLEARLPCATVAPIGG